MVLMRMAAAMLALMGAAQAAETCGKNAASAFTAEEVTENGLVAEFLKPDGEGAHPAMLILGGSEGGKRAVRALATPFAEEGYATLALSYFAADGLPDNLQEIPVEYFKEAIDWLAEQENVDPDTIGVYGISKGAEAALLIASSEKRLKAVIAGDPSHVVWQNINRTDFTPRSSWAEFGAPLPFVPYVFTNGFTSIFALYNDALPTIAADSPAIIPAEKIAGPVLLVSGEKDTMWPSAAMGDLIVERLKTHAFPYEFRHLKYEDAGHGVPVPPSLGALFGGDDSFVGGSNEGNAAARRDMWEQALCFPQRRIAGLNHEKRP